MIHYRNKTGLVSDSASICLGPAPPCNTELHIVLHWGKVGLYHDPTFRDKLTETRWDAFFKATRDRRSLYVSSGRSSRQPIGAYHWILSLRDKNSFRPGVPNNLWIRGVRCLIQKHLESIVQESCWIRRQPWRPSWRHCCPIRNVEE